MVTSAGPIGSLSGMWGQAIPLAGIDRSHEWLDGPDDFVGFKCSAGVNEFWVGNVHIENAIKECLSLIAEGHHSLGKSGKIKFEGCHDRTDREMTATSAAQYLAEQSQMGEPITPGCKTCGGKRDGR